MTKKCSASTFRAMAPHLRAVWAVRLAVDHHLVIRYSLLDVVCLHEPFTQSCVFCCIHDASAVERTLQGHGVLRTIASTAHGFGNRPAVSQKNKKKYTCEAYTATLRVLREPVRIDESLTQRMYMP